MTFKGVSPGITAIVVAPEVVQWNVALVAVRGEAILERFGNLTITNERGSNYVGGLSITGEVVRRSELFLP